MKIALAQINSHLGQFSQNTEKIIAAIDKASQHDCSLVVFPEAALSGYNPMDLLESSEFVEQQWAFIAKIQKKIPENMGVLLGAFSINSKKTGRRFFNSAVFLQKNKKEKVFNKELLPHYGVFDENRHIEKGSLEKNILKFKGQRFLISICEDIWAWPDKDGKNIYPKNPLKKIKAQDVDCVINLSASPFYFGKETGREEIACLTSKYFNAPLIYNNLVGGQDELIFDGSSFVVYKNKKIAQAQKFEEDFLIFNLETQQGSLRPSSQSEVEQIRKALVLGLRDYITKSGFSKAHIGLSGGIDSAVVLCLLVEALGSDSITAVGLPSSYNDPKSLETAKQLAENLGVQWLEIPIQNTFNTMVAELEESAELKKFSIVHENLQARIRGNFLMALSNQRNSMLITTGNKSEYATGYATLYGDMCGGLAPIGDLLKSQVYQLAKHYNEEFELIPRFIIDRPPSAELRPGQKDQDSLPDYDQLDKAVNKLVTQCKKPRGKLEKNLEQKIARSEFKRWQAPPILKVSEHSFGIGRRKPLALKI